MFEELDPFKVETKEDFLVFLDELINQNYDEDFWNNDNIESYLDAVSRFASNLKGFYHNNELSLPKEPNWKMIALMLWGAQSN